MPLDAQELTGMVKEAFPDAEIELTSLVDDGDHYSMTVVSKAFEGKNRIQQHKMVYAALDGKMGGVLHALQLKTATPK